MDQKDFKIPEGYFQQKKLDLKAISEAPSEHKTEPQRLKLNIVWWSSIAAALLIAAFVFTTKSAELEQEQLNLADLQEEEIIDFLSADPFSIHPESFIQLEIEDSVSLSDDLDEELIESYLQEQYLSTEYL